MEGVGEKLLSCSILTDAGDSLQVGLPAICQLSVARSISEEIGKKCQDNNNLLRNVCVFEGGGVK